LYIYKHKRPPNQSNLSLFFLTSSKLANSEMGK
jgi:hypothetical protein